MTETDNQLKRIADLLLLNASFTENPGLLNGKMGIVIFFYHYSRYSGNNIYNEYAGELIDQIYEEINTSTPAGFEDGLTGIGWGIEYLVKNSFVDADTDEALAEIDNTLYRRRLNSAILIDEANSIFGYGLYYLSRLTGHTIDDNDLNTLIKKYHLIFLIDECERIILQKFNKDTLGIDCLNSLLAFLMEMDRLGIYPYKTEKILRILPVKLVETAKADQKAGTGLSVYLLNRLAAKGVPQYSELKGVCDRILSETADENCGIEPGFHILDAIKYSWQCLIYGPFLNIELNPGIVSDNLYSGLRNEDELNIMFDKVNKDNLGLNGMAGVAMFFLLGAGSREQGRVRGGLNDTQQKAKSGQRAKN